MGEQSGLFALSPTEEKQPEVKAEDNDKGSHYNKTYCLNFLEKNKELWDMRAWLNYKDQAEVEAYVDEPLHKNSGHSQWCVKTLKEFKTPKAEIVQAIMRNPNIQYKYRLGACMIKEGCPRLKNAGGIYRDCACWKCENPSNPPK